MPHKITIIGGGSSSFVPQLMRLFIESEVLEGSTITLMDIDGQRLQTMRVLSEMLIEKKNVDLTVESTTNRKESLRGADFVIVTIAVGGSEAWEADIEIPAKYGIYMPIADSVGPGGIMRALRHIPVLLSVCRDLEEVSPGAWVFNYSNPISANAIAMTRETSIRNVGLCSCSSIPRNRKYLARMAGINPEEIVTPAPAGGINHCAGILSLMTVDGEDVIKLIRERTNNEVIKSIIDTYGVLPYCWSHWVEFYPSLCRIDEEYRGRLQGVQMEYGIRVHDMKDERQKARKWDELAKRWAGGKETESISLDVFPSGEAIEVVEIMEALITNSNAIHVVNTVNRGAIPNLPEDGIVEVPAVIGKYGITPIHIGELPESLAAVLRQHMTVQELTAKAAIAGDRRIALEAFMHDPQVAAKLSLRDAEKLLDELLSVHAERLEIS